MELLVLATLTIQPPCSEHAAPAHRATIVRGGSSSGTEDSGERGGSIREVGQQQWCREQKWRSGAGEPQLSVQEPQCELYHQFCRLLHIRGLQEALAQSAIGLAQLTTSFVIRSFWAASSAAILRWYAARRIVRARLLADIPFPCVYALSTMISFPKSLPSHPLLLRSHSQRIGLVLINLPDLRQGSGTAPATSDSR